MSSQLVKTLLQFLLGLIKNCIESFDMFGRELASLSSWTWCFHYLGILKNFWKNFLFIYLFILPFRAAPAAYGGSQARGPIRATAAGLHHSYNVGSEPCLKPTPHLAMPDP